MYISIARKPYEGWQDIVGVDAKHKACENNVKGQLDWVSGFPDVWSSVISDSIREGTCRRHWRWSHWTK